ncbi:hypothetical protein EDD16DRAFT_1645562 [Pisolithus croceorrhizus]|nr:hypothetical protein EV401DRAFT_765512 [Pisolithus croceorrhizus]KAI6102562.1 hypothetical protein EDD16DRAFT_1645562 [Pisolithus croceorrhizus]
MDLTWMFSIFLRVQIVHSCQTVGVSGRIPNTSLRYELGSESIFSKCEKAARFRKSSSQVIRTHPIHHRYSDFRSSMFHNIALNVLKTPGIERIRDKRAVPAFASPQRNGCLATIPKLYHLHSQRTSALLI